MQVREEKLMRVNGNEERENVRSQDREEKSEKGKYEK